MKLNDFDTIIFDLDFTVWNGCRDKYWGKNLISPLNLQGRRITGSDGDSIEFQEGIKEVITFLHEHNKRIGFITLGGLLTVDYDQEPVVECLKMYGIYKYFNHQKTVLFKTDKKSRHIIKNGKTIFIDDNEEVLSDIRDNCPDITAVNRYSFANWKELI